ncbi:unnamed protein product [Symbiodinium sp. CCMP2592]|nr:unnamed protein product [Symbiodinium sp. CCMP2592]
MYSGFVLGSMTCRRGKEDQKGKHLRAARGGGQAVAMAMDGESQRLFVGLDAGTFQPKASALSELRLAKEGLDFRRRDLEDARKRLRATQRRLAAACEAFRAERAGLHAELRALGQSGEQLGQSLASQQVLLQQQAESLDHERLTVDVLKDEVRRMREEQQKSTVRDGPPDARPVRAERAAGAPRFSEMPKKLAYRSTFIAVQEDDGTACRRTRSLPARLGSVDTVPWQKGIRAPEMPALAEPRANEAVESRYVGNLLQRHAASFGLEKETSNDVEKAAEEAPSHKAEPASNDGSFGHPEACECMAASQRTDAHRCAQRAADICELSVPWFPGVRASLRAVHAWQLRAGPKGKLDKRQRQCFDTLNEHQDQARMHQKGNLALGSSTRSHVQGIAEPMAEVLELIRGRLQELEAAPVARPMMPVPRSKSNFLRVILKRLLGVWEAEDRVWTPTVKTG